MSVETLVQPTQKQTSMFQIDQLASIDWTKIPKHVAIIPDGNRRWAKQRLSSNQDGHREGADNLMEIIKAAQELKIKVLTFYSFSTENWARPKEEVSALMALFTTYLIQQKAEMIERGIKLETIGDLSQFPPFLNQVIHDTKKATQDCHNIQLVLAFNYGGRNEICRAVKKLLDDYEHNKLTKDQVDESTITRYLDTANWQDPELLIRTSGELRLSNFLLWQISYTEIHVTPVLWPDFTPKDLLDAIIDYQNRERRWGGT